MKQMAPNKFYEEVDFQNRDLSCKNLFRFFNFLLEGVDPNENKVAQMAALTTCAFVDKASIVTEPHRYAS